MSFASILAGVLFCVGLSECRVAEPALIGSPSSPRQDAVGDIKQTCISQAHSGSCEFFVCFEERHPCETYNYALDYGWRFCSRYDSNRRRLSEEGQRWLNGSMRCTMERLLNYYNEPTIVCTSLAAEMKDAQAACEVENGLCSGSLLIDNREVFTDVHNLERRSTSQFLYAVKHCTRAKVQMVGAWFRDKINEFANLPTVRHVSNSLVIFGNSIKNDLIRFGRFFVGGQEEEKEDANDWSSWDEDNRNGFGIDFNSN